MRGELPHKFFCYNYFAGSHRVMEVAVKVDPKGEARVNNREIMSISFGPSLTPPGL